MSIESIKLTLRKKFNTSNVENLAQEYHRALDKFIYDFGCISGWELYRVDTDKSILVYICTTENREHDVEYLRDWVKDLQDSRHLNVIDDVNVSGEMILDFAAE